MDSRDDLIPASTSDVAEVLMHALCYDGRRRTHDAAELMARLVAERLVAYLERSGFVVMHAPTSNAPDSSRHPHPHRR